MKKNSQSERRGRAQWRALVAEWRASGVTATEFARQRGLKAASLYYWSSVLRREGTKAGPKLLPVQVAPQLLRSRGLELVVGSMRVRFDDSTPPVYVATLARALLETGSQ